MNKKTLLGIALIVASAALVWGLAVTHASAGFIGKAVWYLPYATALCGVNVLRSTFLVGE